eukprot:12879407-Heterocapsa_arctica.AAC.1
MKSRIEDRLHHAATELKSISEADCRAERGDARPAAWHVGKRVPRGGDIEVDANVASRARAGVKKASDFR